MDIDSKSDPYLKVLLGKKVYDFSKEYINDVDNAEFYKYIEIISKLPGES